jgi:hypothetical protein
VDAGHAGYLLYVGGVQRFTEVGDVALQRAAEQLVVLHHHAQAFAPVGYAVALAHESHVVVYASCLVALFLVAAYAVDVWTSGLFGFEFICFVLRDSELVAMCSAVFVNFVYRIQ